MLPLVSAFAFGVLLIQQLAQLPAVPPLAPGLLAGGIALFLWVNRTNRHSAGPGQGRYVNPALLGLAGLLLGSGWALWRAELRLADALPAALEGQDIRMTGVVAAMPQPFGDGVTNGGLRFEFIVETATSANTARQPSSGVPGMSGVPARILLSWYVPQEKAGRQQGNIFPALPDLRAGERWQLPVRLKIPRGNANAGGFDYEGWLFERDLRATGTVRPVAGLLAPSRLETLVYRPLFLIERGRQLIREQFLQQLPERESPYIGVLVALVIGDQHGIDGKLWDRFSRTGITHLLSVSGLHVTMMATVFGLLCGGLWRRFPRLLRHVPVQPVQLLAGWSAALLYTLLAGFAVPAQRTVYMLTVAVLAALSGRRVAARHTLALALLLVLLLDPWAVLAAGFWLSFAAVAALLYASQGIETAAEIPLYARLWQAVQAWGRSQWAATLASLPILLLVFQQFSLVSPLANAIAIPVVSVPVTGLALLAGLFALLPGLESVVGLLLQVAHGIFALLMALILPLADWPVWTAPAPPLAIALLAALGVLILLLPPGLAGRHAGFILLLPALFWPRPRPPEGEFRLDVLDVGQGLAAVVRTRNHTLLYDTGPLYSAESDAGQRILVPWLRHQGIDRIDTLVLSHADSDHSGGLRSLLAAVPVGRVLTSMQQWPQVDHAASRPVPEPCHAGQAWQVDGVSFTMRYPPARAYREGRKDNHLSCVLHVALMPSRSNPAMTGSWQGLLLTGDIEAEDEAALAAEAIAPAAALRADVLLVPHHGSQTSSTPALLDAVQPRAAIIPVGYHNRYGHPHPAVLQRYAHRPLMLWRTDRDGAVSMRFSGTRTDGEALPIEAWRQAGRRYWWAR